MQAKTDEEIAAERQWIKSEKVWVLLPSGYLAASLVPPGKDAPAEGKLRVRLDVTGEVVEVDEEDVEKVWLRKWDHNLLGPYFNVVLNLLVKVCLLFSRCVTT